MKIEPFYFPVDSSSMTVTTVDPTMKVKGVVAFASCDSASNAFSSVGVSGVDDTLKNFCSGMSVNTTTKNTDLNTSKCVLVKNGTTVVVQGGVTDLTQDGLVSWEFPTYNISYYVFGFFIGE